MYEDIKSQGARISKLGNKMGSLLLDHQIATHRVAAAEAALETAEAEIMTAEAAVRDKAREDLCVAVAEIRKPVLDAQSELGTARRQQKDAEEHFSAVNCALKKVVADAEGRVAGK